VGFPRVRLIDDTLAALLTVRESVGTCKNILVYSWGAGTFSAALYSHRANLYQMVAQEGNREFGGDDVDAQISEVILSQMEERWQNSFRRADSELLLRVAAEAEQAKRILAAGGVVSVSVDRLLPECSEQNQTITLSPEFLGDALVRASNETLETADKALRAGNCQQPDVVLIVGGMTLAPPVEDALKRRFQAPVVRADEGAVAIGCVLYGQRVPAAEWAESERPASEHERELNRVSNHVTPTRLLGADGDIHQTDTSNVSQRWSKNFLPLLDRAQQQYEEGRLIEATTTCDRLLDELNRFVGDLYSKTATALNAQGKAEEGLKFLRRAHHRDPLNRLVAIDLAQACYQQAATAMSRKKPNVTLPLVEEALSVVQRLPDYTRMYAVVIARLLHLKGIALCEQRRLGDAELAMQESVRLDPKNEAYTKHLATIRQSLRTPGRNDPCPCGSGRKFKKCCLKKG
jgi:tetratricopeptide (TPR) repeat protein